MMMVSVSGRIVWSVESVFVRMIVDSVMFTVSVDVREVTFHVSMTIADLMPSLRIMIITRVISKFVRSVMLTFFFVVQ